MILSPNEIAFVAQGIWPSATEWQNAIAVCLAESKGDTEALGRSSAIDNNTGNRDHGLWQISNKWHATTADGKPGKLWLAGAEWRNPYVNARLAKAVYDETLKLGKASGWEAWAVWNSGAYKVYLPDAALAIKAPWPPRQ